jgi:L-asparaginase II
VGDATAASAAWQRAAAATFVPARRNGDSEPAGEGFRRSTQRYFQALALRQLGHTDQAGTLLRDLAAPGAAADHYAAGLGAAGLGQKDQARTELTAALAADPDQLGARLELDQL